MPIFSLRSDILPSQQRARISSELSVRLRCISKYVAYRIIVVVGVIGIINRCNSESRCVGWNEVRKVKQQEVSPTARTTVQMLRQHPANQIRRVCPRLFRHEIPKCSLTTVLRASSWSSVLSKLLISPICC